MVRYHGAFAPARAARRRLRCRQVTRRRYHGSRSAVWYPGFMKKTKQCLKCESLKVIWYATRGARAPKDKMTYVCVDCGYYESYFRFTDDLLAYLESKDDYKDRFGWVNPKPGEQGPYR
jgi:hypothetical protein